MMGINVWAVIAAAVAAFLIGGLWYSPVLFAKSWQKEVGLSDETLENGNMALIFGVGFLLALLAAFVFAMFLGPAIRHRRRIRGRIRLGLGGPGDHLPVRKALPEALPHQRGLPDPGLHRHRRGARRMALNRQTLTATQLVDTTGGPT
jgi:hypothetical protein